MGKKGKGKNLPTTRKKEICCPSLYPDSKVGPHYYPEGSNLPPPLRVAAHNCMRTRVLCEITHHYSTDIYTC
jgi:hypothetical protein